MALCCYKRGHGERCGSDLATIGQARPAGTEMSGAPLQRRGRLMVDPVGPVGELIAEALRANSYSLSEAAREINKAAKSTEGAVGTCRASTVRKWVLGVKPHQDNCRWLSAGLAIPLEQLTQAVEGLDAQKRAACSDAPAEFPPARTGPYGPVDSEDMERKRREFLLALTGAAVGGFDVERWASVLAGTRADRPALDDMETLTIDLVRREATVSPESLLPMARGHLMGLRDMLVWTPASLASRAYSLAGQTALLAGYLWFKRDNHPQSDGYWSLASRCGEMAGDTRLRAALSVLQGQRWEGENSPREGENLPATLGLLDRAVSMLGPDPDPTLATHVFTFRARSYAEASHIDATYAARALHDLDTLHTHLSRLPADDGSLYIVESVGGEAVQKGAMTLVHLGRAADAVRQLEELLSSIDGASGASLSWRSHITANLSAGYAAMGEADHACELLGVSLQLAAQGSALRGVNRVRHARMRWLANYDSPNARRLDEQILALSPVASVRPSLDI
jgi:hypothetical protein